MALIDCPSCGKKISDKATACSHCNFASGDASVEDVERKLSLQRFYKLQSLQNQSLVAIILFVAGFGFMYWGGTRPGDMQHNAAIFASVIGFIWYVVNRIRILILKRFSS